MLSTLLAVVLLGWLAAAQQDIRCYSCTTMDADRLLHDVQDPNWRRWLENVRYVPHTVDCKDSFQTDKALRSGVRSQICENGVCMKMWFQQKDGNGAGVANVWRSCIPNAREQIRSDCTKISSAQGDMEVCTCDSHLCNASSPPSWTTLLVATALINYRYLL